MVTAEHALMLADIAADKLERLAADLYTASLPEGDGFHGMPSAAVARTILDSRNEAAGALDRLAAVPGFVDPAHAARGKDKATVPPPARMQAKVIRDGLPTGKNPDALRRWAAAWRAFADGSP